MKLNISHRKEHFNLLDPREESISVHMNIDEDREKVINLQFDVDEPLVDYLDDPHTWADTAIQLIDRYNKRTISPTNKKAEALKEIILQNQKEIDVNKLKDVIEEKRAKMLKLGKQIGELEKEVLEMLVAEIPVLPL